MCVSILGWCVCEHCRQTAETESIQAPKRLRLTIPRKRASAASIENGVDLTLLESPKHVLLSSHIRVLKSHAIQNARANLFSPLLPLLLPTRLWYRRHALSAPAATSASRSSLPPSTQ
jgi:hypothetical protein